MSRRIPSVSDLNIRSEQPIKRFKTSPNSLNPSSYRNIFEQFNDVPPSPTLITNIQTKSPKTFVSKLSSQSQQSSITSSSTARSIMTKTKTKQNDELWSTLFRPKTRHDLILHPKKIKELEESLERSCELVKSPKRPSKLILMSGPSGSGKSTCLRILASSMNINIIEWETRTTSTLTATASDEQQDDRQWTESQKRLFRTFVFQSTRYLSSSTGNSSNGLTFDDDNEESIESQSSYNKQLVLIEDLPNGFYSDITSFHSTLRELKRVAYHPIIFIVTDNSSLTAANNPHLLFSLSIIDELKIEQISFNAIAPTYMKKGLDLIIQHASLLKLKPPSRDCINDVIQTANGDLRLAINTLQFSSNNTKVKSSSTTNISKDTCLSLFQGLGRILYKKDSEENSIYGNTNQQPENLIEQCHISASTFIGFLFENYLDFYSLIDDIAQLCDHLSTTEYILNEWETRSQLVSISSSIACRAVRLCNSTSVQRGFKPMRKPQDNDVKSRAQKNRTLLTTNKLFYGCSEEEYFTNILPYQACLLKVSNSSTINVTNRSIIDIGYIDRYSKRRYDMNSMVTEKNNSIGFLTDNTRTDTDERLFDFSLNHATTIKLNKFEYDDSIDIDSLDD
ncbi:hypothetical protein I4U23_018246 [Adineta vaga]|nr:hypothetical protein I4U23_018246 [Adineta vaga]